MPRVKRGVTARASHKKVLAQAKGYRGRRKNVFRVANEAVMKAGQYAYRDRRQRKRQFRTLWIARINAAARETCSGIGASLLEGTDFSLWVVWLNIITMSAAVVLTIASGIDYVVNFFRMRKGSAEAA